MVYVSRDPFARTELHKKAVKGLECKWCGGTDRRGRVWQYYTEHDGGRVFVDPHFFCSVECYRLYHSQKQGG